MPPPAPAGSTRSAPDGGWGWLIVAASFVLQGLTIGITYTFGVLFVELLKEFDTTEAVTSWIGSIQPWLLYFTGFVMGPLLARFGWRPVTIFGSILSAVGFVASSFSPNVYLLYFTYGVLTGIGNGLMYVTSMVTVQHYFDRRRSLATGLAVSGSGFGTLTFGFLTQMLIDNIGWRNALRVQALVVLLGVPCGALYRPLPEDPDVEDFDSQEDRVANWKTDDLSTASLMRSVDDDGGQYEEDKMMMAKPPGCCSCCSCCSCSCSWFREVIDLSLFKNPIFSFFCMTIVMFCFGYHVPYAYTPERAVKMGVDPKQASFLVSIMGIANVCSRLGFGWVADRSATVRMIMGGVTVTLGGVVSIFISFFNTYTTMIIYCVLFGAFTGCWASLFPCILVDLLGMEMIEKSMGQALASGSFAFLVASPMSGWIIQATGSYDLPYIVVGSLEALGGVFYTICFIFKRRQMAYESIPGSDSRPRRRRYTSLSFT